MNKITTPAYIIDETLLRKNLSLIKSVQERAGVQIILAFKAFAMWKAFPIIREYIQYSTASSPWEAQLAVEEMGSKAHTYSPAYTAKDFPTICKCSSHITFNSLSQFQRFYPETLNNPTHISCGLRINPEYSEVETDLYNPAAPGSRLGITRDCHSREGGNPLPEGVEGLHFHTLCESTSYALEHTLQHVEEKFGDWLPKVKWLNMGGGHLMTRKDYDVEHLIQLLQNFKVKYPHLEIILEPGAAFVWQTGVLVSSVVDIVKNRGIQTAILDVSLRGYFEGDLKPSRIIAILEDYFGAAIHPQKTLIIFDEIQECPRALTSLKYFAETAPQYDIIAAGSLLGVALKNQEPDTQGTSFPVGKVYIKTMYPLNFEEFLWAKQKTMLANEIEAHFASNKKMPAVLHNEALELYREYLIVGGMPLVVQTYVDNSSTPNFADIQKLISASYTADMTKYTEKSQGVRNIALYNSIPAQLGNSDKLSNKFVYSAVEKGARTVTFKDSVDWLETAGIALQCTKTTRGDVPPAQYADQSSFKLYLADVGLLSQILKVTRENLQLFNQMYRGAITENYIAMALTQRGHSLYFWETNSNSEVDFVVPIDGAVIPIEVKSSENNRSKSLNAFIQKYKPQYAVRISEKNFGYENDIKSVPLYAAFCL